MRSLISRRFSSIGTLHHVPKFYKRATVESVEDDEGGRGYTVKLDQRSLKTADGHRYVLPSPTVAHIVALEFMSQKQYIVAATMPLVLEVWCSSASRSRLSISSVANCCRTIRSAGLRNLFERILAGTKSLKLVSEILSQYWELDRKKWRSLS